MPKKQASNDKSITSPQHQHHHCSTCGGFDFDFGRVKQIAGMVAVMAFGACLFVLAGQLRPIIKRRINIHVTNASLSEFNYTSNVLIYNVSANFTFRNKNEGVYYDKIVVMPFYQHQKFGYHALIPFYHEPKNTTTLNVVFAGQNFVTLEGENLTKFHQEKVSGVYSITFDMILRVRFELIGGMNTKSLELEDECSDLKIPLNGTLLDGSNDKCNIML